jgi:hypothetical protein
MPGVEFKPRALVKGSAYDGYRTFTPIEDKGLPEFSGLVASSALLHAPRSDFVRRELGRDLAYSWEELQPFFIDQSVGASIRRALGRRFDAIVSADRHRYGYRDMLVEAALVPTTRDERVDITWNYSGSVGYRLGKAGRVGFGAS